MTESFHVRVTKDYLVFSAAHFVTFNRDVCERLHGHNYRVAAEIFGPLDENHFVVDFVALRETLKLLVDELDHHVLLPTSHPEIRVEADDRRVRATFRDLEWVFPRGDCVLLPVANTSAELIASYLGHRLLDALEIRTGLRPQVPPPGSRRVRGTMGRVRAGGRVSSLPRSPAHSFFRCCERNSIDLLQHVDKLTVVDTL